MLSCSGRSDQGPCPLSPLSRTPSTPRWSLKSPNLEDNRTTPSLRCQSGSGEGKSNHQASNINRCHWFNYSQHRKYSRPPDSSWPGINVRRKWLAWYNTSPANEKTLALDCSSNPSLTGSPISPHPHQCFLFSVLFFSLIVVILKGVRRQLIVVLICISLMIVGASFNILAGHLYVYLEENSVQVLCPFLN